VAVLEEAAELPGRLAVESPLPLVDGLLLVGFEEGDANPHCVLQQLLEPEKVLQTATASRRWSQAVSVRLVSLPPFRHLRSIFGLNLTISSICLIQSTLFAIGNLSYTALTLENSC
jgi:hypothetical protein